MLPGGPRRSAAAHDRLRSRPATRTEYLPRPAPVLCAGTTGLGNEDWRRHRQHCADDRGDEPAVQMAASAECCRNLAILRLSVLVAGYVDY